MTIVAFDAAGNRGETATVEWTVDTVAPAPVEAAQVDGSSFTFAGAPGDTFACRLEGPTGDTGFVACTSPQRYPGLGPGDYRFTLQTVDAAGNRATAAARTFSIPAAPAAATPAPLPVATPRPTATPAPTPQAGKTVVVRAVSGRVLVRRPESAQFVAL